MRQIRRSPFIRRKDLRANPEWLYVFGDNLERRGFGGQAKEMRGEPNAFGIATKRAPGMKDGDFFADRDEEINAVAGDLEKLKVEFENGRTIVIPTNGIGGGRAELKTRSPRIHALINSFFAGIERRDE